MRFKCIEEVLPKGHVITGLIQNFEDSTEGTINGKKCYYLGTSEKTFTLQHRVWVAVRSLAKTIFSLGFALDDAVREDLASAWQGKRVIKLYANSQADALNLIGDFYFCGSGLKKDLNLAARYSRLAADQGHVMAQYNLGICYQEGDGVEKDERQAFEYFKLAADQDDMRAQYELGLCYAKGLGVEKDDKKAFEYFKLAAKKGHADAQYSLGNCYIYGVGVEKDAKLPIYYIRLAANQDHSEAQHLLGVFYELGLPQLPMNVELAVDLYRSAAKNGHAEAQFKLGEMYNQGKGVQQSREKAIEYYKMAAQQNDALAKQVLSRLGL